MSDSDSTQKKSKSSKIKKFIMEQFDKTNDKLDKLSCLTLLQGKATTAKPDSDSYDDDYDNDGDWDCTGKDDCRCWVCESYKQDTEVDEDEYEDEDENEVVVEKASRVSRVRHYDEDDSSEDDDDSDDSDDGSDDDSDWTDEDFED